MFPMDLQEQDGLLCDETVAGIQKWVAEIGEQYVKVEVSFLRCRELYSI